MSRAFPRTPWRMLPPIGSVARGGGSGRGMAGVKTSYPYQINRRDDKLKHLVVEVEGVNRQATRMCARARARKNKPSHPSQESFTWFYPFHLNQGNDFKVLGMELPRTYPGLTPAKEG